MHFDKLYLWPLILLVFILIALFVLRLEKKYFQWVKDHWFFERRKKHKLTSWLYLVGLFFILLSLLDLRGKPIKVEQKLPKQNTILLIDTSSSMLVEDVRPNRFQKAILIARHFVKKAAGHNISIVLFSDLTKRFVPFTDDYDLLDTRLSGLSKLVLKSGGSNLSRAIQETIQYFEPGAEGKSPKGNIIVFSDSEETSGSFNLTIGDGINLAFVAIGTRQGGPIPLRNDKNKFLAYKKYKGERVISKLNEDFLKNLSEKVTNFKYWVAISYSLPTEEILKFFKTNFNKNFQTGFNTMKPVHANYLLFPGFILLTFAFWLRLGRTFILPVLLLIFIFSPIPLHAQDEAEKKPSLTKEQAILKDYYLDKLAKANIESDEKMKLAELYLREGEHLKAKIIYKEAKVERSNNIKAKLNAVSVDIKDNNLSNAAAKFLEIRKGLSDEEAGNMRKNILLALNNKSEKGQSSKDEDKDKEKDKDKENKDKSDKKDENQDEGSKGENQKNKKKDKGDKDKEGKEEKDKDKENKDKNKEDGDQADQKEDQVKDNQKQKRVKRKKIPALLKQLMDGDKKIQGKMLDTKTDDSKNKKLKDW